MRKTKVSFSENGKKINQKYGICRSFRGSEMGKSIRYFGTLFTLCLKSSMLERYLDIKNGKWSGNGMEIENAFENAKIVDKSARLWPLRFRRATSGNCIRTK